MAVYFAHKDGRIKIGMSSLPTSRVRALKAETLALVPGGFVEEQGFHEQFAADRLGGEWFAPSPALMTFIETARPFSARDERQLPNYGARVRAARERAGLSQEQLAARAHLGVRTVQRLENNQFYSFRSTVACVALALGTTIDALRGEEVA